MKSLAAFFRKLPEFKGKLRLANFLFHQSLLRTEPLELLGKNKISYHIPNTIDHIGKELFIKGIFEKETIDVIRGLLSEDSVFFDVGANIGAISLPIAKFSKTKVHAFEPSNRIFEFLKRNVEKNGMNNISLNNTAVYSEDGGKLNFYPVLENYGGSSLAQTYSNQPRYHVNTISLDAYCKRNNIDRIDVLKIDVQGFEIEVLRGSQSLLENKAIDHIVFEFEDWAETNAHFKAGVAQEYLLTKGYQLYTLKNKKIEKVITSGSMMLWAKLK